MNTVQMCDIVERAEAFGFDATAVRREGIVIVYPGNGRQVHLNRFETAVSWLDAEYAAQYAEWLATLLSD